MSSQKRGKKSSEEVFNDIITFGGVEGKRIMTELSLIDLVSIENRRQLTKTTDCMILRSQTQKM